MHNFIDPDLRRVQLTWDDLAVPARLRELAEETWQGLDKLASPDGDTADVRETLDEVRAAYTAFYAEAEAVTESTSGAARRDGAGEPRAAARLAPSNSPSTSRVPHGVRAMIPPRARRAFRRAVGR